MVEGKAEEGRMCDLSILVAQKWVASVLTENEFWHNK